VQALYGNKTGNFNTASGTDALYSNTTGSTNIADGYKAGYNLTTGSNNIDIGNLGAAAGSARSALARQRRKQRLTSPGSTAPRSPAAPLSSPPRVSSE
jgi:hypothetical protein